MKPGPTETELLQYLADLGWSDLYLRRDSGASSDGLAPGAVSSGKEAKDPSKGAATAGTLGPSRAAVGAAQSATRPGGGSHGSAGSGTPRESGPTALVRRPAAEVVAELDALAAVVASCRECKLCTTRNLTVFASGDSQARLMLVGEGPGAEEDKQGLPFVGAAGELLNKILAAIGLARDEVYVANIVKCRPPGNRDPEPDEVRACRGYLEKQLDLVRPAVVVALGRYAAQTLLGTDASLTRLRGEWHDLQGIPLRVTYHPAALLRNAAWKRPTWEDMQAVRDFLQTVNPQTADPQAADPGEGG